MTRNLVRAMSALLIALTLVILPGPEAGAQGRPLRASLSSVGPDANLACTFTVKATYWRKLAVDRVEIDLLRNGSFVAGTSEETLVGTFPSPWTATIDTNGSSSQVSTWTAQVVLSNDGAEVGRTTTNAVQSNCN